MLKFENTLTVLDAQRKECASQIGFIEMFERLLSAVRDLRDMKNAAITYEVHFRRSYPNQRPIMTTSTSLSEAYEEAVILWEEYNDQYTCGPAEVFVCNNDFFIALSPADAALIASAECGRLFSPDQFGFDKKMIEKVGATVWKKGQQPGRTWYAGSPTPEKKDVEEPVVV